MNRKLDFSDAWTGAISLLRAHGDLVFAVAGVFIFLPAVLTGYFLVPPEPQDPQEAWAIMRQFYADNWYWLLLAQILSALGSLAILALLLEPAGTSVGRAIGLAATIFPVYIIASILAGLAVGMGLLLLLIPGIYLAVKFLLVGPVMIAEKVRNPLTALGRSWRVTKGNSIMIFLFVFIVALVGLIALMAINAVVGIVAGIALPLDAARFVTSLVSALLGALLAIALLCCYVSIYRQLALPAEEPAIIE